MEVIMTNINYQISIRSSAAEYLTYVAFVGESSKDIEIRYEEIYNLRYN